MKKRFTVSTAVLSALLIGGLAIALAGVYQQNLERKQQELAMEAMNLEARATALDDEWRNQEKITPDQLMRVADTLYGTASEYGAAEDVKYAEEFRDAVNSAFVTTTNQTPASKRMIRFNKVWNITSSASLETILKRHGATEVSINNRLDSVDRDVCVYASYPNGIISEFRFGIASEEDDLLLDGVRFYTGHLSRASFTPIMDSKWDKKYSFDGVMTDPDENGSYDVIECEDIPIYTHENGCHGKIKKYRIFIPQTFESVIMKQLVDRYVNLENVSLESAPEI
ncbi:MAG: hypothetical protein HXM69_05925 [Mogibacterium diversum]|nr:hypothetical protein [Mogibacterium diversum]